MTPYLFGEELVMIISGLLSSVPSMLLGVAAYVLTALAIYTISCRRGLNKPWLAWIPVLNVWLLGSLSDQYQYVVRGENKSKRKVLLILSILKAILWLAVIVLAGITVTVFVFGHGGFFGATVGLIGLLLPLGGVTIAHAVIRYMALYDVYKSLDPANAVLFLVLSILFGVTEPFFLFFNRDKDLGMPPRKQEPVYTPPQEPWDAEEKDYL